MPWLRSLVERLTTEHLSWFGAGLSVAAVVVLGYQLLLAALPIGLPGPQPAAAAADGFPTRTPLPTFTPFPTRTPYPTRTPFETRTPFPTRTPSPTATPAPTRTPLPTFTPFPTRTPSPTRTPAVAGLESPDALATLILADPERVVAVVATAAARTNQAFDALEAQANTAQANTGDAGAEATPRGRR